MSEKKNIINSIQNHIKPNDNPINKTKRGPLLMTSNGMSQYILLSKLFVFGLLILYNFNDDNLIKMSCCVS